MNRRSLLKGAAAMVACGFFARPRWRPEELMEGAAGTGKSSGFEQFIAYTRAMGPGEWVPIAVAADFDCRRFDMVFIEDTRDVNPSVMLPEESPMLAHIEKLMGECDVEAIPMVDRYSCG